MNAKASALVILIYAVLLFAGAVYGALLTHDFSIYTIPVAALVLIGPAIGIYRRINWCRVFLGIWAVFVFCVFLSFCFRSDFVFRPACLGFLFASGLPVFLLFFYPPLKHYTQNASRTEPSA